MGPVSYDDLEPWSVYSGVPAVKVKMRTAPAVAEQNS